MSCRNDERLLTVKREFRRQSLVSPSNVTPAAETRPNSVSVPRVVDALEDCINKETRRKMYPSIQTYDCTWKESSINYDKLDFLFRFVTLFL